MAYFAWRARAANGEMREGAREATAESDVVRFLVRSQMVPVEIRETVKSADAMEVLSALFSKRSVSLRDLVLFCRQMYALTKSGVPMNRSIKGLRTSAGNRLMESTLRDIEADLDAGMPLSEGMAKHPKVFPQLMVSVVRVGETTGGLEESFMRLQGYLSFEEETVRKVKAALRYPVIVIATTIVVLIAMLWFVVPAFADVFSRAGAELPLPTRVILGLSDFVAGNIFYLGVVALLAYLAWRAWIQSPAGERQWDKFKLRVPLSGEIVQMAAMARFGRALSIAYAAGVPVLQALQTVADALNNRYLHGKVMTMRQRIEEGLPLSVAVEEQDMFTPLVVQMLQVGEESGRIDEMMTEIADFYEREVEYRVTNLSSAIEPLMLFIVGCMVLMLALAIFLPMWQMTSL